MHFFEIKLSSEINLQKISYLFKFTWKPPIYNLKKKQWVRAAYVHFKELSVLFLLSAHYKNKKNKNKQSNKDNDNEVSWAEKTRAYQQGQKSVKSNVAMLRTDTNWKVMVAMDVKVFCRFYK